jgi:hypothetical protein
MTVQQHAPRLTRVGPTPAIPAAVPLVLVAILLIAIVALVVYAVLQSTPLSGGELEVLQKLQHLRETIPGGFI